MRLTARARLTVLFGVLIAVTGAIVAGLVILLAFTPVTPAVGKPPPGKIVDKATIETITTSVKAQAREELAGRLTTGSLIAIAALTVLAVGLGWLLAGRVLRPVHVVSGTARRLSEQNLHERIPVTGPNDEMRELAETFNGMLARLQRSFDAQSHFAANAAHELRGPMTTQRTLVEVAAQDGGEEVRSLATSLVPVLERQERLVDGLLALAWSEHGVSTVERVPLDPLVRSALGRTGTSLNVETALNGAVVDGDPVLLDLLVDNLIRNAVTHNEPGGGVWIRTGPRYLEVVNTGQPIAPDRLESLTQPFRRGTRDRIQGGGTGLGLAIVTAVAHAHNATLNLTPRPGGGVHASVHFPYGPPS